MQTSMTLPPPPVHVGTSNPLVRALRAPFELRTWKETLHLLLNMPVGIVTFTIVVTGLAIGFGLAITLIGIPILFALLYVSRAMGTIERVRAALLLDAEVPSPYRPDPPRDTWWRVHVARATDPATWIELGYHLLLMPIGVITFTIVVTFWTLALGMALLPLYAWTLPEPIHFFDSWINVTVDNSPLVVQVTDTSGHHWIVDTPIEFAIVVLLGLVVLLLTPWVVHGVAAANRAIVRGMLGSDVTERVRALTASRSAAVDLAAEDRRRIERDLHDGVQQRLVTLAMDLGRAKEKLGTDPGRAKELVEEARGGQACDHRGARPRPRDPPGRPHRPRARPSAVGARRALADPGRGERRRRGAAAGVRGGRRLLRRERGARERREARERHARERDRAPERRPTDDPGPGRWRRRRRGGRGIRPRRAA
jgi:hypothetical protein